MSRRGAVAALAATLTLGLTGCAGDPTPAPAPAPSGRTTTATAPPTPSAAATSEPSTYMTLRPAREPRPIRGIDASHHQGPIDWEAVAGDRIRFAYLKASEGTSYTDPTFAGHRDAAQAAGIRVGGYHYFSLCSDGAAQAQHFAAVLGELSPRADLPPAVDLELAGQCATPPGREALLAEVRTFLDAVDQATGRAPVVYLYPEFEAAYGLAGELDDHRQWVRRIGDRPPVRDWWIWQRDDAGRVAGIGGPVDINIMAR